MGRELHLKGAEGLKGSKEDGGREGRLTTDTDKNTQMTNGTTRNDKTIKTSAENDKSACIDCNKIKVMYTNADVLTNKTDLLQSGCKAEMPHIIGINEVKPNNQRYKLFSAEFNLEELGFDMFPNNIEEDTGRGQLLYVSK